MMCSERELELSDEHDGIIDLPADAPVGTSFAAYAKLDDPVIEINLTPNRPDATGVHGIARDLAASGLGTLKTPAIEPVAGKGATPVKVRLDFGATDPLCHGFALRLVRGVKNGASPKWLQQRLIAIGLRPINALVDITNYVTFDRGRPLHVFDAAKVKGDLVVRRARDGEKILALDGRDYALTPEMCVIADDNGLESIAGVMGGEHSGCDEIDHRRADRVGAVGAAQHRPHRPHARHHHRCALPFRARRRSGIHGAGPRTRDADGARFLRRRAGRNRSRRLCRPRAEDGLLPGFRSEAPDRPRRAEGRKPRHPDPARLRPAGFGRRGRCHRAVLAPRRRWQGRSRRGGDAHPRRRQDRPGAAHQPRRRQRQNPDHAADPHPRGQAGARRARHDGGRHLVVHPGRPRRAFRRRQAGTPSRQPDRRRHVRHAALAAAGPRCCRAAQCRQGHRRCRAVRGVRHL